MKTMNRISNALNCDYEKKIEKLNMLKNFLINTCNFKCKFVIYPHFLLLEDSSLTYYVESRKCTSTLRCVNVYRLTDKAQKDIDQALLEFKDQYGYNISYCVDNYGEIQFYVE